MAARARRLNHKTAHKPVTQHFGCMQLRSCCCPQAALAPQPHLLMDAAPSVTYASARNPVAAIKTAILRTIEERSDNPRKVWAALCASARVEVNSSLTTEEFTKALKYTGTGIQLTPGDTELVLGAEPLTFARFQKFVAENPSW